MDITIRPQKLQGTVAAIPSKSQAHRLLICAAFSDGETSLLCPDTNRDIEATADCLRSLGAEITRTEDGYRVTPLRNLPKNAVLNCCESGSTLRFLVPVAAALGIPARFTGCGRLPARPMDVLTDLLRQHGVRVVGDNLPITLSGTLESGIYSLRGDVSTQYITDLLLALPLLAGESEICLTTPLESAGYVEMTLRAMARFGASRR
jgi:3-phosphoshikimate 1-carboxyvinyltransferase